LPTPPQIPVCAVEVIANPSTDSCLHSRGYCQPLHRFLSAQSRLLPTSSTNSLICHSRSTPSPSSEVRLTSSIQADASRLVSRSTPSPSGFQLEHSTMLGSAISLFLKIPNVFLNQAIVFFSLIASYRNNIIDTTIITVYFVNFRNP
jgi:hypothetical protein